MSKIEMLVIGGIAAGLFWLVFAHCTREERRSKTDQDKLELQRRALGIKPGVSKLSRFYCIEVHNSQALPSRCLHHTRCQLSA